MEGEATKKGPEAYTTPILKKCDERWILWTPSPQPQIRSLDEKENDAASEASSTTSRVWDNDWCSAQKIDDHVSLEENQQSKKQKIKRYEETAYYDLEEDDDPLMLHMQRAPQPKGFKIPTWRNMTDLKTLRNKSRTINQSWKYWKQTTRCYVQV